MSERVNLTEEQQRDLNDLKEMVLNSWWAKLDIYRDEVKMYDAVFSTFLKSSHCGLFDVKFQADWTAFLKEMKKEEDEENCLLFNREEMLMMKRLKWCLTQTCETERQFNITFELKSKVIKKRAFYRHMFATVNSKIKSGEYECHKDLKDLLKKVLW
jgi:hypothetical protein